MRLYEVDVTAEYLEESGLSIKGSSSTQRAAKYSTYRSNFTIKGDTDLISLVASESEQAFPCAVRVGIDSATRLLVPYIEGLP